MFSKPRTDTVALNLQCSVVKGSLSDLQMDLISSISGDSLFKTNSSRVIQLWNV